MEKEKIQHLSGTTTVGLVCRDGVVFATDTRATMGYLVASKQAKKVYKITNNVAVTVAGGVADTEKLVEMLSAEAGYFKMREDRSIDVKAIARVAGNLLNSQTFFPYIANLLVGGVDSTGAKIYFIDLDGGLTEEKMAATGSGSPVAYGVLETQFKDGMNVEEALPIAIQAIKTAMKRDIATGNEVEAVIITQEGYKKLDSDEIKKLA